MQQSINLDLVILGGGVAGLWTLNRALAAGYNAVLFEQGQLGGGQTVHAQGIIHGGAKYSLNGVLSPAANAVKDMPLRWRTCISGDGEIDLRKVRLLSDGHYLWSIESLGARLTTFFASKALRGRVTGLDPEERPVIFQNSAFNGALYRLDELVLDVRSLVEALAYRHRERIFQAGPNDYQLVVKSDGMHGLQLTARQLEIHPTQMVVTCGEGYRSLANALQGEFPEVQIRPLHMVMVKHCNQLPLYAHCLAGGSRPVVTVTTHYTKDNKILWYLGGALAEAGVERDKPTQVQNAMQLLDRLLPWISLEKPEWATVRINRAEPRQGSLTLPDAAFAERHGNVIVAWPTKLALAPDLADKVLSQMVAPSGGPVPVALHALPRPTTAEPIWEQAQWS